MNKLLVILLIVQAAFIVSSNGFRSKQLARERIVRQSNVEYIKTENLRLSLQDGGLHKFYEAEFSTRVDHFRPLNQQRVNFTYNVNTHHFENYGPLYIYFKGCFEYSTEMIEEGLMVDIAEQTGGALLIFDYRYFGRNRPFDSASYDNLELFFVEQALADAAVFIRIARQQIPTADYSKVILWGSGFGGALAVFARSRYPHLIHAVWSSSGFFETAVYSSGPYDILAFTFDINDDGQCRDLIRDAFEEMATLVRSDRGAELAERLHFCYPVDTDSSSDVGYMYEGHLRGVMSYLQNFHYEGVLDICEHMQAFPGEPLNSFVGWYLHAYGNGECWDRRYSAVIERYSNPAWDQVGTDNGRRQWYFLQCTQVGSFLVADNYTWLPFTINFDYHLQKCTDLFGANFTYETVRDAFYTLRDGFTQRITNALYTNGNVDPFRYFGRLFDPSFMGRVINIDMAGRSVDLTSISSTEPESFTKAKEEIVEIITRWALGEEPTEPTEPPVSPTPEPEFYK